MNNPDLRDFFASQAMKYFLEQTTDRDAILADMELEAMVAVQSYMMADAMMFERTNK